MVLTIKQDDCLGCSECHSRCPQGAIKSSENTPFWIDPTLCNECPDIEVPPCQEICYEGVIVPLQAKKGRHKSAHLPGAIPAIFLNGKTHAFASSIVVWEACNLLAQRQDLPWHTASDQTIYYQRALNHGRGSLKFRLNVSPEGEAIAPMTLPEAEAAFKGFDIRATCMHLIFAAYITTLEQPWQDEFELNDQHIEHYLGLDRRKDLTKLEKLTLIKELVYQTCQLLVTVDWPRQGKISPFSLSEHAVWQLLHTEYFFEQDSQGYQHLIGLSFRLKAGLWTKYFLNRRDYRRQLAFYQYGTLPRSVLTEVMSNWQQHEGAIRLLLWLLFKLRLGSDHRVTVRTLLKVAYGEVRVLEAITVRGGHKRLLKTFEQDLEALHCYGLSPVFDPETYPMDIQPLWVRVAQIPEAADEALEF
jgi:NAD-dependent dihydropyrimidine dehydrogenase PreA subunit